MHYETHLFHIKKKTAILLLASIWIFFSTFSITFPKMSRILNNIINDDMT